MNRARGRGRSWRRAFGLCAALAWALVLTTTTPALAAGDDEVAREQFRRGVESYQANDFVAALEHFRESYRLVPLAEVLHNVALTERALGHDVEALACFERYRREVSDHPERVTAQRREFVDAQIAELKARVAQVAFDVTPSGARVVLDGKPVSSSEPAYVVRGLHRVEVSAPEFRSTEQPFSVEAGSRAVLRIVLEPRVAPRPSVERSAPSTPRPFLSTAHGVGAIATGALGVSALVAGGTFGLLALDRRGDYDASCRAPSMCDPALYDEGRRMAIAADVLLVAGAVSLVATAVLVVTRPTSTASR